jgi:hypothetical protein
MWRTQEGIRRHRKIIKAQTIKDDGAWFSWLERLLVTQETADSAPSLPPVRMRVWDCCTFRGPREHAEQLRCSMTNKRPKNQASKNRIFILPRAIC